MKTVRLLRIRKGRTITGPSVNPMEVGKSENENKRTKNKKKEESNLLKVTGHKIKWSKRKRN